jgi:hypothetical protein
VFRRGMVQQSPPHVRVPRYIPIVCSATRLLARERYSLVLGAGPLLELSGNQQLPLGMLPAKSGFRKLQGRSCRKPRFAEPMLRVSLVTRSAKRSSHSWLGDTDKARVEIFAFEPAILVDPRFTSPRPQARCLSAYSTSGQLDALPLDSPLLKDDSCDSSISAYYWFSRFTAHPRL